MEQIRQSINELVAERDELKAENARLRAKVVKLQETILSMYQDSAAGNNPVVNEED